ncbi:hypothetical protein EG812_22830 [Verrucosispora sp. FIM060022]|nr:hypothetical protein EG812_22830 [Verrucosispora sp. FIM060022]
MTPSAGCGRGRARRPGRCRIRRRGRCRARRARRAGRRRCGRTPPERPAGRPCSRAICSFFCWSAPGSPGCSLGRWRRSPAAGTGRWRCGRGTDVAWRCSGFGHGGSDWTSCAPSRRT